MGVPANSQNASIGAGKVSQMTGAEEAEVFLKTLFSGIPKDHRFYLWLLPSKLSYWFSSEKTSLAATFAANEVESNVYVGVSIIDKNDAEKKGDKRRVTKQDSGGIVGLWCDIDYGEEGHKGAQNANRKNPPTEEDALYVVSKAPLPPSVIIHSGNGLQTWWLFKEPIIFRDDEDRSNAQQLAQKWMITMGAVAAENDWDLDSTYDIARVFRVPGTYNLKPGTPKKQARIIDINGNRYVEDDFTSRFMHSDRKRLKIVSITPEERATPPLVLSSVASPPGGKLLSLMMIDQKFVKSYNRNRQDMKDNSNSGYDFSLASIAARAGWSDQEIVNLIIASRRECGQELNIENVQYYMRTIHNARQNRGPVDEEGKTDNIDGALEKIKVSEGTELPHPDKEGLLELLSSLFNVGIKRIVRYVSSPPYRYSIETYDHGSTDIGGVENLIGQIKLRNAIADLCKINIPKYRAEKWDNIAQILLSACVDEDVGENERDLVQSWISDYLYDRQPTSETEDSAKSRRPLIREGSIYIFADNFRSWLAIKGIDVSFNHKTIGTALRKANCMRETVEIEFNGEKSTRSMWRLPRAFTPEKYTSRGP